VEILGRGLLDLLIMLKNTLVKFNMFFHGYYAIKLMVCNEAFLISCAHGQDFKTSCITMAYNTPHDLVLRKVDMLIIIHLKDCPCD
jgi:hypothetical protein